MKLIEYFNQGVRRPLGYSPTSSNVKPVHLANGLFRSVLGQYFDPRALNHTVVRWALAVEKHPTPVLLQDFGDLLGEFAEPKHLEKLNLFRHLLRCLVNADGAVFDGNRVCSYTATSAAHVTEDISDKGTGSFLYHLLTTEIDGKSSPILDVIRDLLKDKSDEISVLTSPLTADDEPVDAKIEEVPDSLQTRKQKGRVFFVSEMVQNIRTGFDQLAEFEKERGSKLYSLRRIVTFANFAIYTHLINRTFDYEAPKSGREARTPMLFDFLGERTPVGTASHSTYVLAKNNIERMFFQGVRAAVIEEHGERLTQKRAEKLIEDEIEFKKAKDKQVQKRQKVLKNAYQALQGDDRKAVDALALALVETLQIELTAHPRDFARSLGIRMGLLAPRANRAERKRYAPSPELLELLTVTVVGRDERITVEKLVDRWWNRYGIVTGAHPRDAGILNSWAIYDASRSDLTRNAEKLREALTQIGYARRFADGVTEVRWPTEGGIE